MSLDLSHPLIEAAVTLARAVRRVGSVIPKGFAGIDKLFEACGRFEAAYIEEADRQDEQKAQAATRASQAMFEQQERPTGSTLLEIAKQGMKQCSRG